MNKVLLRPLFRNAYLKKSEKKLDVKKFNVGGFSRVEKRNLLLTPITSALLQARKMPGEGELGALARAFGKGIQTLPQTQLAIRELELEEKAREEARTARKFGTSKEVFDVLTNERVFKPEEEIQTVTTATGEPRYVPVPDVEKKGAPKEVFDVVTGKKVFTDPQSIYTAKTDTGEPRYLPVGDKETLLSAYPIIDGKQATTPKYVKKSEILNNPNAYVPVEGNLEMMLKKDDLQLKKKAKQDANAAMLAARDVASIITRIEKDVAKQGAFTGRAADTVLALTGATGFIDSFVSREQQKDTKLFRQQYQDTEDAIMQLTNKDSPNYNARITAYLNAPETQAAKTSIINLAYAIAKAREPGGRFSVPDIELALQSIGESSNKQTFLSGLRRIGLEITDRAIKDYETVYDVTRDEIPKGYSGLIDRYNYFQGVEFTEEDANQINPDNLFGG